MFITPLNHFEMIANLKPEFMQFAKRVKYKPICPSESLLLPKNLSEMDRYILETKIASKAHGTVDEQIFAVQDAIESYAKSKNVLIDMTRKLDVKVGETPELNDRVVINLYNPKTRANVSESIPVFDEAQTVTTVRKSNMIIDYPEDGTQVVRPTKSEYEDNFLRYLYRTIENLVKRSNIK